MGRFSLDLSRPLSQRLLQRECRGGFWKGYMVGEKLAICGGKLIDGLGGPPVGLDHHHQWRPVRGCRQRTELNSHPTPRSSTHREERCFPGPLTATGTSEAFTANFIFISGYELRHDGDFSGRAMDSGATGGDPPRKDSRPTDFDIGPGDRRPPHRDGGGRFTADPRQYHRRDPEGARRRAEEEGSTVLSDQAQRIHLV